MAADVEKGVDLSVAVADHDDRVFSHITGEEITRIGELAVVAQEPSAARDDRFEFLLVHVGVGKNTSIDQFFVDVYELFKIHPHARLLSRRVQCLGGVRGEITVELNT